MNITDFRFLSLILYVLKKKIPGSRIQANYVMWRAAASTISYLNEAVRKRQLDYSTELSGRTEREPRWKECVDTAAGRSVSFP